MSPQGVSETNFEQEILCCVCYYKTIRKFVRLFVVSDGAVDYVALFDDEVTVLTDEARAACAAAFAYRRKLEKYASLKLPFAMSPSDPRQLPRAESRVAGFSEAMRVGVRTTTTPRAYT